MALELRFTDTGCHVHPSCLACPEIVCIYDEQPRLPPAERDAAVVQAYREGTPTRELQERYHLNGSQLKALLERTGTELRGHGRSGGKFSGKGAAI